MVLKQPQFTTEYDKFFVDKTCRDHCTISWLSDKNWHVCMRFKEDNFQALAEFEREKRTPAPGFMRAEFLDIDLVRYAAGIRESLSKFIKVLVFTKRSIFPIYLYPYLLTDTKYCALRFHGIQLSFTEVASLVKWTLPSESWRNIYVETKHFILLVGLTNKHVVQIEELKSEVMQYVDFLLDLDFPPRTSIRLSLKSKNFEYFERLLASTKWSDWSIKTNRSSLRSMKLLFDNYDRVPSGFRIGEEYMKLRYTKDYLIEERNGKVIILGSGNTPDSKAGIPRGLGRAFSIFDFHLGSLELNFPNYSDLLENLNHLVRAKCVSQLSSIYITGDRFKFDMRKSNVEAFISLLFQLLAVCPNCTCLDIDSEFPVVFPAAFFSLLYRFSHVTQWGIFKSSYTHFEDKLSRMKENDKDSIYKFNYHLGLRKEPKNTFTDTFTSALLGFINYIG